MTTATHTTRARQWYQEQARLAGREGAAPTTEQLNAAHRAASQQSSQGGGHFEIFEPSRRRVAAIRAKACGMCRKLTTAGGGCPGAAVGERPMCHSDEADYTAMIDAATVAAGR